MPYTKRRTPLLLVAAALLLGASAAEAQLITDRVPRERVVPLREEVKKSVADARWDLGPLRLQPSFDLKNLGYDDNVYGTDGEEVGDWTASVSAGVDAILPLGRKLFIEAAAHPEYVWYQELDNRRDLGGVYGASLLALFNRMSVEVRGQTSDTLALVTSETERPATSKLGVGSIRTEIDLLQRLSIFGSWESQQIDYAAQEETPRHDFDLLDRDDSAVRAGVRYRFSPSFDFSAGVEKTESEFEREASLRNNETEALFVGVRYDRPRFYLDLNAGRRDGRSLDGSNFVEFEETTGSWFASWFVGRAVEIQGFGSRRVVPGLFTGNPYFIEDRTGAGIRLHAGSRTSLLLTAETGSNDYPVAVLSGGALRERSDDTETLGAGLSFRLWRSAHLVVRATDTSYDSNIAGYDRSVMRIMTGLSFRGD